MPLPLPRLERSSGGGIPLMTDERLAHQTGIHIYFSGREGGVSAPPFDSLNLSPWVGDNTDDVERNRTMLLEAIGAAALPVIVPKQVHGTAVTLVNSSDPSALEKIKAEVLEGCDAVIVTVPDVVAQLNFADCIPIIAVSPSGSFGVIHAGWRGVEASIAPIAVEAMASADGLETAQFNIYIGPHIRKECFECSSDVHDRFTTKFGSSCAWDDTHIDLTSALIQDLERVGISQERIADSGLCTVCTQDRYYSFRGAEGTCGRHGALAYRSKDCEA